MTISGIQNILNGSDTVLVDYPSTMVSLPTSIVLQVSNTSDAEDKLSITATLTASTLTGFTAGLSQVTNSVDYKLIWVVVGADTVNPEDAPSYSILTADELRQAALDPRKVSSDGQSVENHSLQDLIALDKYNREKTSASKKLPFRLFKIVSPRDY